MAENCLGWLAKVLARFTNRRSLLLWVAGVFVSGQAARGEASAGPASRSTVARSALPSPLDDVLLTYWRRAGGERSWLGAHVRGPEDLADGEVAYFERGALWRGAASEGDVVASILHPPLMGCPDLCTPDGVLLTG